MKRTFLLISAFVLLLLGCGRWLALRSSTRPRWRFAQVEMGEVSRVVTATGTLNALTQVSVGTQVSGVVTHLYADFNSIVKAGEVVARIDPAVLETQVADAQAVLRKATSAYQHAKADLERNRALAEFKLLAAADLEVKVTAFDAAAGDLESAQAALRRARINLGYCTIVAPVDGVVVSRVVDEGQTVAASFTTPSLFAIAKDLSRMKLQAAIDESDIGQIQAGQAVQFSVDSYPGLTFQGQVSEVQLNPTISNNVVTYGVVMEVANVPRPMATPVRGRPGTARYLQPGRPVYRGELALFPGMTATVSILTVDHPGVLRVPNLALRFDPQGQSGAPGNRIWVLEGGVPVAIPVTVGVTGAQYSEVQGPGLRAGMSVLTGREEAEPEPARSGPGLGGPPH